MTSVNPNFFEPSVGARSNYKLTFYYLPNGIIRAVIQDWGTREVNDGKELAVDGVSVHHMAVEARGLYTLMENIKHAILKREECKATKST